MSPDQHFKPIGEGKLHRVILRWYCESRRTPLCYDEEEHLCGVKGDELDAAREKLYAVPFTICSCGTRISRSMHVEEDR